MQLENKLFCHWDLVRFVTKKHLQGSDGTFLTLSVTDDKKFEFMIFLGKDDSNTYYEVRVHKSDPNDKYVQNVNDNVIRYEENDEYATFFFKNFTDAHDFVAMLGYRHSEYRKRPVRKITEND